MELLETVSTHPFENHQLEPPRLVPSPTQQPTSETSTELIPNQIGNQHERLFQMCKLRPSQPFYPRSGRILEANTLG